MCEACVEDVTKGTAPDSALAAMLAMLTGEKASPEEQFAATVHRDVTSIIELTRAQRAKGLPVVDTNEAVAMRIMWRLDPKEIVAMLVSVGAHLTDLADGKVPAADDKAIEDEALRLADMADELDDEEPGDGDYWLREMTDKNREALVDEAYPEPPRKPGMYL
jgi:hypothetical protein